jgi:hypothetical protein
MSAAEEPEAVKKEARVEGKYNTSAHPALAADGFFVSRLAREYQLDVWQINLREVATMKWTQVETEPTIEGHVFASYRLNRETLAQLRADIDEILTRAEAAAAQQNDG